MDNVKKCDICKSNAEYICFQCPNYFCDSCFNLIHNIKNIDHKKDKLDPFVPPDIKCENHPRGINDYFCVDEKGNYILIILTFL